MLTTVFDAQRSFLDCEVVTDIDGLDADVAFLGVPFGIPYALGQSSTAGAPNYLRAESARFRNSLKGGWNFDLGCVLFDGRDVKLVDCGNVPGFPMDIRRTVDHATEIVAGILARGVVPIVFGGDDAIPIPVVRAYRDHGPLVLIQIDQHLDFLRERNGVTEGYSSPMRRISEMPWVEAVFQLGQGGVGSAKVQDVNEALAAGHRIYTDWDVHERGIDAILADIPGGANYFITVDYDGLDPSIAPAVSNPEPGGLTFAEARVLFCGLARKGRIVGMDWAELVPAHDNHALTACTTGRLVLNLLHAMSLSGQIGG